MPNGTYGGVRGRKTKVGRKLSFSSYLIGPRFPNPQSPRRQPPEGGAGSRIPQTPWVATLRTSATAKAFFVAPGVQIITEVSDAFKKSY